GSTYQTREVIEKLSVLTSSSCPSSTHEGPVIVSVTTSIPAQPITEQRLIATADTGDRGDSQIGATNEEASKVDPHARQFNAHDQIACQHYSNLAPLEIVDVRNGDLLVRQRSRAHTFWVRACDSRRWN